MAGLSGDARGALTLLDQTSSLYESVDKPKEAARAAVRLLRFQLFTPDREEAIVRAERAFELLADEEPDESVTTLAVMLSRVYWFNGDLQRAAERVELALDIAEPNLYVRPLSMALLAKAANAFSRGHLEESMALIKRGLEIALEHDFGESAATVYFLLSDREFRRDRYEEALAHLREALALARRVGTRPFEWGTLAEMAYPLFMLGRWDEALSMLEEPTVEQTRSSGVLLSLLTSVVEIYLQRGDLDAAKEVFALFSYLEGSADVQDRSSYLGARASIAAAEGRLADALEDAEGAIEAGRTLGYGQQTEKQALRIAFEAAVALGDEGRARALASAYNDVPPATRSPFLEAETHRFRARLDGDESRYEAAAAIFRELDLPFFLAVTLLDQGKHLDEAREIFERLRATPWLQRLEALTRQPQPAAS